MGKPQRSPETEAGVCTFLWPTEGKVRTRTGLITEILVFLSNFSSMREHLTAATMLGGADNFSGNFRNSFRYRSLAGKQRLGDTSDR
jgi:hypothetical protein